MKNMECTWWFVIGLVIILTQKLKNKINWYEIPYFDLIDSRTIFIDPSYGAVGADSTATSGATGSYLGIGFNLDNYISIDTIPKSEVVKLRIIWSTEKFLKGNNGS